MHGACLNLFVFIEHDDLLDRSHTPSGVSTTSKSTFIQKGLNRLHPIKQFRQEANLKQTQTFFSIAAGSFSWNFPRDAVDFLARSAAFWRSWDAETALAVVFETIGANPTPGTETFLARAMFRSRWSSFLATRSLLSLEAFSNGSTSASGPLPWKSRVVKVLKFRKALGRGGTFIVAP